MFSGSGIFVIYRIAQKNIVKNNNFMLTTTLKCDSIIDVERTTAT